MGEYNFKPLRTQNPGMNCRPALMRVGQVVVRTAKESYRKTLECDMRQLTRNHEMKFSTSVDGDTFAIRRDA